MRRTWKNLWSQIVRVNPDDRLTLYLALRHVGTGSCGTDVGDLFINPDRVYGSDTVRVLTLVEGYGMLDSILACGNDQANRADVPRAYMARRLAELQGHVRALTREISSSDEGELRGRALNLDYRRVQIESGIQRSLITYGAFPQTWYSERVISGLEQSSSSQYIVRNDGQGPYLAYRHNLALFNECA